MALAFLFNRLKQDTYWQIHTRHSSNVFRISDNILGKVTAIIIDHGLRDGSDEEAKQVAHVIKTKFPLYMLPDIEPINWRSVLGPGVDPKTYPNIETLARKLRYGAISSICRQYNIVSMFTAHHEDDEYETILMRMISGRGYRGLQGIPPAADYPECYDAYGVYQSGYLDDQESPNPFWTRMPSGSQRKKVLKHSLRDQLDPRMLEYELAYGMRSDGSEYFNEYQRRHRKGGEVLPQVPVVEAEDGGIMIYRPLLGFSKDRLIATCEENDIPWFEDHTNADPTFTPRNAIRWLVKHRNLPAALQKPAILQLGARCRARVAAEEAEAGRVLDRLHVHDLSTTAGIVEAEMPRFKLPRGPRLSGRSAIWREKRLIHYRTIAAIIVRRLISLVTPNHTTLPTLAELGHSVSLLFPELRLADDMENPTLQGKPRGYTIAGVYIEPLIQPDGSVRWRFSRAPFGTKILEANNPVPSLHELTLQTRFLKEPSEWPMEGWKRFTLWDGRYWMRISHRAPRSIRIAPFEVTYQKDFREGLLQGDKVKNKSLLDNMLKVYAPGRIRYTLPALYADADFLSKVVKKNNNNKGADKSESYWPQPPEHLRRAAAGISEDDHTTPTPDKVTHEQIKKHLTKDQLAELMAFHEKWEEEIYGPRCTNETYNSEAARKRRVLIALPTLGLFLPGVYDWVQCEVRYRKIDGDLLRRGTSWQRPRFWRTRDKGFKLRRRMTLLERRDWWGLRRRKAEEVPVLMADAFGEVD